MINYTTYNTKDLIFALKSEYEALPRRAEVIRQTLEILEMVDALKELDRHSEVFQSSLEPLLGVEKK